jgi:hypothetical protein
VDLPETPSYREPHQTSLCEPIDLRGCKPVYVSTADIKYLMYDSLMMGNAPSEMERPINYYRNMSFEDSFDSSTPRKRQCRQRFGQNDSVVDDGAGSQEQANATTVTFTE